ncbi:hypothetical protein GCM10009834_08050 [Streptomonospora arabica]
MRQSSRQRTTSARWGRSPEHTAAHAAAANLQARHPGSVIWFGEISHRYYVMDPAGLHEFPDTDAVRVYLWGGLGRRRLHAEDRAVRFGDGLDDLRSDLSGPLRALVAVRPDARPIPAPMAGAR